MLASLSDIAPLLACPNCGSALHQEGQAFACDDASCRQQHGPFLSIGGVPILVDFSSSILDRATFEKQAGQSALKRDPGRSSSLSRLKTALHGVNRSAAAFASRILRDVVALKGRPVLLVIGGGTIGYGTRPLYDSDKVRVIGTDIFVSPYTTLVADGHHLPFKSGSIDGVWIQAVLEHVVEPAQVVAEIHRVLAKDGLVYADTPFMQQVHEGAYDFTRFTLSGHRWLFRKFDVVAAGHAGGPGTALRWSTSYFIRAVTGSDKLGALAGFAMFWTRFFDRGSATRRGTDAASGTYIYGRRSERTLAPKDLVAFYDQQPALMREVERRL